MNLALQDPFTVAKEFPDTLVHTLQYGHSVYIQFNRKGDYLASGLSNGAIVIYDLSTNTIVCVLSREGHVRPITSISWSHCGRYLLSSSQDWACILWDLQYANTDTNDGSNKAIVRRVQFDGPIWQACIHPKKPRVFTASLFENDPVYVNMENETEIRTLATEPVEKRTSDDENENDADADAEPVKKTNYKHMTLVTQFTTSGDYIFSGTSRGWLNIIDANTLQTVHLVRVTSANMKTLVFSPDGRKLAVNSSDRIIRQINLPDMVEEQNPDLWEFEVEHRYQDVVNRLQWNTVAFSHNSEFLVASTFGQSSQDLYLWETSMGTLIKILEGSHEELIDVKWNYNKCMIGSTGLDSGSIYLWLVQFPLKWSALAPDFVEIEENEEYEEKEDEFDIIDETDLMKRRLEEEDTQVDIATMDATDVRGFDTQIRSFVIPVNYELAVV
ncbi:hypothetical protein PUMCH_000557 [Australozyma saopauloensis]|uniref:COMPASS component SWD1 n=1 Tax=Australozyma saopauloensis TaxID=291208 RepID=A0AAX4H414_9ASCO|nr:hypothetical protein PUMCH_000557 [[Candida] saopauloensis]